MGAVYQQVYLYKRVGSSSTNLYGWSTTATDLSNLAINVEVRKGIMNVKDTASFLLARPQNYYPVGTSIPTIEFGDLLRIWFKRDSTTFVTSDMMIEGVVSNVPLDFGPDSKFISIKLNDFFEEFFSVQIPVGAIGKQKTWVEILRETMNMYEFSSRGLFWDSTNPTVKADAVTSFPAIDFAVNYTPFYQIVEKLSSNQNTEDGQYSYYVTTDGTSRYLTLRSQQETTSLGTFTEGTNTENIKIEKDKDDVKNYVIFNCGNDLAGNPIEFYYADFGSIGAVGFKEFYMIEETADLAETIMQEEARENNGANFNWANGKWNSNSNQYPTAYPYTWVRWTVAGVAPTSTSAADFDNDLRAVGIEQGAIKARDFVERTKAPKYRVNMGFRFRNDFTLGGLYQVEIPTRNLSRQLRIAEVTHTLRGTDITFEEDQHRRTL